MAIAPGPLVLFGSGETSRHGRGIQDRLMARQAPPVRVAVIETPAGFQPNCDAVHAEIKAFFEHSLQNHRPAVTLIRARQRGTAFDPDNPLFAVPILDADYLFAGPGSPTYAVRQWRGSVTWRYLCERWAEGTPLVLASAAVLAVGAHTLPVYEIYKVGMDLHWVEGLDLLAPHGLHPVFVPHWNNQEGGATLDTSRCYMGADRFDALRARLPPTTVYVGIDEHTACLADLARGEATVAGAGGVTVLRGRELHRFAAGETFPLALWAPAHAAAGRHG